jgi:methanogenic corrinoid protein MtbC1
MIDDRLYERYMADLLAGRRVACKETVEQLLANDIALKELYAELFQRSLYRVGELWETNQITVANEQLATSITESLMLLAAPKVFKTERADKSAVISCGANEFHQVGGKMVADLLELNGWDTQFLGANTPPDLMLNHIQQHRPDVIGFSLGILSHLQHLKRSIDTVRGSFPQLDLIVGGQAFRWGGVNELKTYRNLEYISSLDALEAMCT